MGGFAFCAGFFCCDILDTYVPTYSIFIVLILLQNHVYACASVKFTYLKL